MVHDAEPTPMPADEPGAMDAPQVRPEAVEKAASQAHERRFRPDVEGLGIGDRAG